MFEPAEIPYNGNMVFHTTERMLSFQKPILEGKTYPLVIGVGKPRAILDIGANHGAASLFFADAYPEAVIYAYEPSHKNFELLQKNTAHLVNVSSINAGINGEWHMAPLFAGPNNEGEASQFADDGRSKEDYEYCEFDTLEGKAWAGDIDLVKIDVEGAEVIVLNDVMRHTNPTVIYLEYQNAANRVTIDAKLLDTHNLVFHRILGGNTGEMIYVKNQ